MCLATSSKRKILKLSCVKLAKCEKGERRFADGLQPAEVTQYTFFDSDSILRSEPLTPPLCDDESSCSLRIVIRSLSALPVKHGRTM